MYLKSSGAATILPAGCGPATERKKKELATAPAFFGDRNVCGMYGNPIGRCKVAVPYISGSTNSFSIRGAVQKHISL
jgi:hypothetical protein